MISRWLDHLPPWLAWLALAGTGLYEGVELAVMALPLVAALSLERHRLDLSRWRWMLELVALVFFLGDLALFRQPFPAVVHLLCLLCGLRLALPRQRKERRQLLLMGFLLLLTTAVTTTDLAFLGFLVLWAAGTLALLMQMAWEEGAQLRRGLSQRAPFGKLPVWILVGLGLAGILFVLFPRTAFGLKPLPLLQRRLGAMAGLGDSLDLAKEGPIQGNDQVALRITPLGDLEGEGRTRVAQELALLKAMSLEQVEGLRWSTVPATPLRPLPPHLDEGAAQNGREAEAGAEGHGTKDRPKGGAQDVRREAEVFASPTHNAILALPYGLSWVRRPLPLPLRPGEGGSLRWAFLPGGSLPLRLGWSPADTLTEERGRPLPPRRRAALTALGPDHEAARRLGQSWAPLSLPPRQAASALQGVLERSYTYTLANPSGKADNPLAHFLEVSRSGHCEYFASALALMLRARDIPARVATGYRLGPWNPEGGYFLVTQNQAHAWVEYWDDDVLAWRVADPSPLASESGATESLGTLGRLWDAATYRWNRYVVRYSGQDQMEGLAWTQARLPDLGSLPLRPAMPVAALLAAAWILWRRRRHPKAPPTRPEGLRALRPLVKRVRKVAPPEPGETLRAWMGRLAKVQPRLKKPLADLADAAEGHVYGGKPEGPLREAVKAVVKDWEP